MNTEPIACLLFPTTKQVDSSTQRNWLNNEMYLYLSEINAYSKNIRFKRTFSYAIKQRKS